MTAQVAACIVNHNVSAFAELALRSLVSYHQRPDFDLDVVVLDNHSDDPGFEALRLAGEQLGVPVMPTRWPAAQATFNTHGDVLGDFVGERESADYFLFLDADIFFIEANTVGVMLSELGADPGLWAIQARFWWVENQRGAGLSLDLEAGKPIALRVGANEDSDPWAAVVGSVQRRLHPACALVRNTPRFQEVAKAFGLGCSVVLSGDPGLAGYYDTLALASRAMEQHGLQYALSRATIGHYFNVSYDHHTDLTQAKLEDCQRRLDLLRSDPLADVDPGPWG